LTPACDRVGKKDKKDKKDKAPRAFADRSEGAGEEGEEGEEGGGGRNPSSPRHGMLIETHMLPQKSASRFLKYLLAALEPFLKFSVRFQRA
jgi:hypothetical protein